jgi:hypothetical protein
MSREKEKEVAQSTRHSKQRTKDRLGLSKKLADKKAQEALDHGLRHKELTGGLKKYITSLYFYNETANNIRVYQQKVYIFRDTKCITILNLPQNLCNVANKLQKRKDSLRNNEAI